MEIQFHRNGPLAPWRGEVSLLGTIPWRVAFCKSNAKQKTSSQAYARSLVPKEAAQLAIFHLSAKIISRGKGQSAIASAAYRSGDKLHDERYDETQDYTNKRFIEHSEIQLPKNAPKEYQNRETLWNSVEKAEKAKNSQLAREIELALPRELSPEQRITLVHDYVQTTFVDKGMVADWSIHNPQPDKDNPEKPANPHAHIMLTLRSLRSNGSWAPKKTSHYELDENGQKVPVIDSETGKQKLGAKNQKIWKRVITPTNDWNNPKNVEKWRSEWAKTCNKYLAPDHQIDHRSYKRQGKKQIPTIHEGYVARKMEREATGSSERASFNQFVKYINNELKSLREQIRGIIREIRNLEKGRDQDEKVRLQQDTRANQTRTRREPALGGGVQRTLTDNREQSGNGRTNRPAERAGRTDTNQLHQQSFGETARRIFRDFRLFAERQREARQRQRRLSQGLQHRETTENQLDAEKQRLTRQKHVFDNQQQQITERQNQIRKAFRDAPQSQILERYYARFHQRRTQPNHARGIDYQGPILGRSRGRSR